MDPPAVTGTPYHRLEHTFSQPGTRLLTVQARAAGQPIAFRALRAVIH